MKTVEEMAAILSAMLPEGAVTRDEAFACGASVKAQTPAGSLREALSAFLDAGYFLESLTCVDFEDTLDVVYHLNAYAPKSRVVLHVLVPHGEEVPSAFDIFPAALWKEREVHDMFGLVFTGSPDMRPLILPEDADFHPLRKTFGKVSAYRKREAIHA